MSDSPTQDVLVKLEGAVRNVSEWLDMKMRTGQYSIGLVVELAQHLIGRGYNVHTIYDEIGILEGDDRRASLTKAAAPFQRPPLLGLWHMPRDAHPSVREIALVGAPCSYSSRRIGCATSSTGSPRGCRIPSA